MILDKAVMEVDIKSRLDYLKMRRKPPLIYHAFNVSNIDATVNIQINPIYNITKDSAENSTLVLLLRYDKMPTLKDCDLVRSVSSIKV